MRQFTIAAATVAIAALTATTPGLADHNGGGPIVQNGQCWKASKTSEQAFGYWRPCGEKASVRKGQAQSQGPRPTTGRAKPGNSAPY
jgi:hypothetical protein